MKADTLDLRKIFEPEIRYVVPMFQRPYVWNQADQWDPLWEDITAVAEDLLANGEAETRPHFLGAVVVAQQPVPVSEVDIRHVIDGQQRLTTLQLLLDAVEEVVREHGQEKDARLLRKMILNDEDLIEVEDHRYKVWPTNVDRDAFAAAMHDDHSLSDELADQQIARAHIVFKGRTLEWALAEGGGEQAATRLTALVTALRGFTRVVVIDLAPEDNAQLIFETLNARGTPLLASDLVKNHLLHEAESSGLNAERIYTEHWIDFDSAPWREDVRQGRFFRPKIDVFLYHWLAMNLAREVSNTELFSEFRGWVTSSERKPDDVIAELARFGTAYQQLEGPLDHSPFGTFLYRWQTLQATAMTPLLLWLLDSQPSDVVDQCVAELESWLMRRLVCRRPTKGYTHSALQFVGELRRDQSSDPAGQLSAMLAAGDSEGTDWPTDREVVEAVLTIPLYNRLSRGRLRLVLEGIEDHLRAAQGKAEEPVTRNTLTIEHVMPQKWSPEAWPLPVGDAPELTEQRRVTVHTLGNLTLLNKSLNPALSNGAWDGKRVGLKEHSVLHLNKSLIEYDQWDEAAISERGRELAGFVCSIWPAAAT